MQEAIGNLHAMRNYTFTNANIATLSANLNKFLSGQAVTAVETGTVLYAAGEVRNKKLHSTHFEAIAGPVYTVILFYSE